MAIGKSFTPGRRPIGVPGDGPGAGRIGVWRPRPPILERIAADLRQLPGGPRHADHRRRERRRRHGLDDGRRRCAERQRRIDLREARRPMEASKGLAGRGDGPCPRGACGGTRASCGPACSRAAGRRRWRRRRPVLDSPGPDLAQPGGILRRRWWPGCGRCRSRSTWTRRSSSASPSCGSKSIVSARPTSGSGCRTSRRR